jgi:Ser/Thr protein kinase RdoA (MazF antagonist)
MDDPFAPPATTIAAVLAGWGIDAADAQVAPLPVSGASGSPVRLVRPSATGAAAVLKAFATGTPRHRAAWVHGLMRHLSGAGVAAVPDLLVARDGDTLVTDARGDHWELVRFVDGCPTDEPSAAQAAAAAAVLARLHAVAATLPATPPTRGPSPGVATRIERAQALLAQPWRTRLGSAAPAALADRVGRAIDAFTRHGGGDALAAVARTAAVEMPLQAVLRDVWSDHVLFARERPATVAGIIDYHAAGIDTPATDLARLLGSWRPSPAGGGDAWTAALVAYEAVRPLCAAERALVPWLHATGVVFGLDNWFRWTLEEDRRFADPARVLARIDRLSAQLPAALESLRSSPGDLV